MSVTTATIAELLKERYDDAAVRDTVYKNHPAVAMLPKSTNRIVGKYFVLPIIYGHNQAVTPNIANSITRAASAQERAKQFQIPRVKLYNTCLIDGELMNVAVGGESAFVEGFELAVDGSITAHSNAIASQIYRAGFGDIGTINAADNLATTTLLLGNSEDIVNWEVDMQVVFASTQAASVLRTATTLTVTAVNRSANPASVTLSATPNSLAAGIAVGDFIFPADWRQNSATPVRQVAFGMEGWVPTVAPVGGDSFCNVDRSTDVTRLAGHRFDASSPALPIDTALKRACAIGFREGAVFDHCFLNPSDWQDLADIRDSNVRYVNISPGDAPTIGFEAMQLATVMGKLTIIPDPDCPVKRAKLIRRDTWEIMSVGELVHIVDDDGKKANRASTADAVEVRFRSYWNVGCKNPSQNMTVTLA